MSDAVTRYFAEFLMSSTNFLALPFERNFQPHSSTQFAANNWPLCIGFVASYLLFIYFGKMVMDSQKAFDLRIPLAAWNAFLCLFSFIGMCRTVRFLSQTIVWHLSYISFSSF
jgi:hypothetical protein